MSTSYGTLTDTAHGTERRLVLRMAEWAQDQRFTALRWSMPNDASWCGDALAGIEVRRDNITGDYELLGRRSRWSPVSVLCALRRGGQDGPVVVGGPAATYSASAPERVWVWPRVTVPRAVGALLAPATLAAVLAPAAMAAAPGPVPPPVPNHGGHGWVDSPVEDALHISARHNGMVVRPAPHGLGDATLEDEAALEAEAQQWIRDNVSRGGDFFTQLEGTADPAEQNAQAPAPGASQNAQEAFEAGQAAKAEMDSAAAGSPSGDDVDGAQVDAQGAQDEAQVDTQTVDVVDGSETEFIPLPDDEAEAPEPALPVEPAAPPPPVEPVPLPAPVEPAESVTDETEAVDTATNDESMPDPADLRTSADYYREAADLLDKAASAIEAGDALSQGDAASRDGQGGGVSDTADADPVEQADGGRQADGSVLVRLPGIEITVDDATAEDVHVSVPEDGAVTSSQAEGDRVAVTTAT